jgi:NADH:ubiquinone oxidoreductase subunit 3 (subunit A)
MIFLPGIIGMEGFNGGFALSFFGGFVVIVGIITVIVFARLASLFDSIMTKENILVHWTYSPDEWKQYTEEEHKEDKTDKRRLFLLVAVISVIVGIILCVIYPHDLLLNICIILGIIAVIGLTAYLSQRSVYRWNKKYLGEVYIAKDGAYLNRRLHIWKGLSTRLVRASYEVGKHSLPRIIFEYSSQNLATRNYYAARIPVPLGQEEIAQKIVEQIQASHQKK